MELQTQMLKEDLVEEEVALVMLLVAEEEATLEEVLVQTVLVLVFNLGSIKEMVASNSLLG